MLWTHPAHEGRRVRLAYCLNLHPADDLDGAIGGMRSITLPLRIDSTMPRVISLGAGLPGISAVVMMMSTS